MELITSATQGLQSFAKRVQKKTKDTFFLIYEWLVIVHVELACIDNVAILLLYWFTSSFSNDNLDKSVLKMNSRFNGIKEVMHISSMSGSISNQIVEQTYL